MLSPTCVTLFTVADDLSVSVVLVTRSSKVTSTVGPFWTRTWTALTTRGKAQNWVAVVTIGTPVNRTKREAWSQQHAEVRCLLVSAAWRRTSPVTLVPAGVVPAADAGARPLVALVGVTVALARSAAGEAPVSRLASVAALAERPRPTLTHTGELVAESRHGALQAATAGCRQEKKSV